MSVIKPPRVYFDGFTEWDPNTCNNNKWLHFWDMKTSELDWATLKAKGVNPSNFRDTFQTAASTMLPVADYACQKPSTDPNEQEALWNYFGGNGCDFVNNKKIKTVVSSGVSAGSKAVTSDPLIGEPIRLLGNPFNNHPTPARLIDLDAASTMTSQIWFDRIELGNLATAGFSGERLEIMHSRFVRGPRNLSYGFEAGGAACIWQCSIPNDRLIFSRAGLSPMLDDLRTQAQSAEGIMIRFVTYLTLYFKNGEFNDLPVQPRNAKEIEKLYLQSFANDGPYFSNPAYSRTVGTIGIWRKGEMQNAPSERTLFAVSPVPQMGTGNKYPLGPVLADVTYNANNTAKTVHLDFGSTIPEIDDKTPKNPVKADFGNLDLKVQYGGAEYPLATITPTDYNGAAYLKTSGMIDLAAQPLSKTQIEQGTFLIEATSVSSESHRENINLYQTDTRATYLDQDGLATVNVSSRTRGGPPDKSTVSVVRYRYDPQYSRIAECGGEPLLVISNDSQEQIAEFVNDGHQQIKPLPVTGSSDIADVLIVNCDASGDGRFQVHAPTPKPSHAGPAAGPGFIYLVFFPGDITQVAHLAQSDLLSTGCYGVVRVLPFDDGIQQQFVDLWNGKAGKQAYDRDAVWEFIYNKILYFYDMIYPVMSRYVPLGELTRVEAAVDQLQATLSAVYAQNNSTMAMPITRDLSEAKRWVLLSWCDLVKSNYQPIDLPDWQKNVQA